VIEARRFPSACVASPHYLASTAGLGILASGGNALDAAVATNLVLAVVAPYSCGLGGDLFALVWSAGALYGYNGAGGAPAQATADAVRSAAGSEKMPEHGPHSVTVPGAVEAWFSLLERFGTRSFGEVAEPALRYARSGFPLTSAGADAIRSSAAAIGPDPEWNSIYGGATPGRPLRQINLDRSISTIAVEGPQAFYSGAIAEHIAATLQAKGGLMSVDDLRTHEGEWVTPMGSAYRGMEVLELPPPTQGVTALEALGISEIAGGSSEPEARHHHAIEAIKLALADRDGYVTDPGWMSIDPYELLSKDWLRKRAGRISPDKVSSPLARKIPGGDTAYMCTADVNGMCVSLIQSNFDSFGSGLTVPGWGINLHNRGASFSLDPEDVNVIAPGKRPLHTLIPAMVLRRGQPWLVFGSMGGHGQAQIHLQVLTRIIDDGADVAEAIDAPRWIVSPEDWSVAAEARTPAAVLDDLRTRGHRVAVSEDYDGVMGHANAIQVTASGYAAASDPRSEGAALGF
jgi:gamma-glutamyltranspeptidase / glutathione hydrolase